VELNGVDNDARVKGVNHGHGEAQTIVSYEVIATRRITYFQSTIKPITNFSVPPTTHVTESDCLFMSARQVRHTSPFSTSVLFFLTHSKLHSQFTVSLPSLTFSPIHSFSRSLYTRPLRIEVGATIMSMAVRYFGRLPSFFFLLETRLQKLFLSLSYRISLGSRPQSIFKLHFGVKKIERWSRLKWTRTDGKNSLFTLMARLSQAR
jgi:hypothetical protein